MNKIKACSVCGRLVSQSCYHEGRDLPSLLMSPDEAIGLLRIALANARAEVDDIVDHLETAQEKSDLVKAGIPITQPKMDE